MAYYEWKERFCTQVAAMDAQNRQFISLLYELQVRRFPVRSPEGGRRPQASLRRAPPRSGRHLLGPRDPPRHVWRPRTIGRRHPGIPSFAPGRVRQLPFPAPGPDAV